MDGDGQSIRWILYVVLVLLILIGGFFAAAETAFSYCNKTRIKNRSEDDNDRKAKRVQYILDRFDNTITTILIGTNVTHIIASTLATVLAVVLFGEIGSLYATIVMTLLVFIFSETLPKNLAKVNADKMAELTAIPIIGLMYLFMPLVYILTKPFQYLMDKFGRKDEEPDYTEEDLQTIVETIEEEGVLEEDESALIQSAIEFDDISAFSIYTPTKDIIAIDINLSRQDIIQKIMNEERLSRIPVYRDSIDNIIGVIHVRTALRKVLQNPNISIYRLMTKPYFIAPSMKLDDIFEGFSRHKTHMAIVRSNDKTIGLITMNDVLRELITDYIETEAGDSE